MIFPSEEICQSVMHARTEKRKFENYQQFEEYLASKKINLDENLRNGSYARIIFS
jgi:hypothetical protein